METLKPCPFCAAAARYLGVRGGGYRIIARHEAWCPMTVRTRDRLDAYETQEEAADSWNRRDGVRAEMTYGALCELFLRRGRDE